MLDNATINVCSKKGQGCEWQLDMIPSESSMYKAYVDF